MPPDHSTTSSLDRFLDAQREDYAQALAELRAGKKRTHWIWYVLPQLRGLGSSPKSQRYGIESLDEATRYLAHPVLGARLRECVIAIDQHRDKAIETVLGDIDALKYRSCLTLFGEADTDSGLFTRALERFFRGSKDERTLQLLSRELAPPSES